MYGLTYSIHHPQRWLSVAFPITSDHILGLLDLRTLLTFQKLRTQYTPAIFAT